MPRLFLSVVFCLTGLACLAQQVQYMLSGRISHNSEALPFATIFVKGTSISTSSNEDGYYQLKLNEGNYEIVFQYIGFEKKTENVHLTNNTELNVSLTSDGITLQEIDVKAGEDPAVAIMRMALKKRKFFLEQLPAYSCKAYIKAVQKVEEVPKNIGSLIKLVGGELADTNYLKGILYLSESESEFFYRRPADVKEIMYSSKRSGDNRSFSFNKLSDMKMNFYRNLIDMGTLSNRPYVSPLNDNAFFFYKFHLLGSTQQDGTTIHTIRVISRNPGSACFNGLIYIQDSTWRLSATDLYLTKETKINFVDTLHIRQLYAPVNDSVWMPFSLNMQFSFRFLGFKGGGYFNAMISDYNLTPEYSKDFFKNEILVVKEGSNKKDSTYWNRNRAIPLTDEEITDYREKDSLSKIKETDRYRDSVDRVYNRLKLQELFLGYRYSKTKKQFTLDIPGLIMNGMHYNTVEGLNLSLRFTAEKTFDDFRQYILAGRIRYGFANQLWGGETVFQHNYKPKKQSFVRFTAKSVVEQYNREAPITPLVNTLYTLLENRNYMKLYLETGGAASYFSEIWNGVYFFSNVSYYERTELENKSKVAWINDESIYFTSNNPDPGAEATEPLQKSNALNLDLAFNIRFKQQFISQPYQKIVTGSKYPRVGIRYKKAIPLNAASADFDYAEAYVGDGVRLGVFGRFSYQVEAGYFLSHRRMYFMDYRHFLGNQTFINTNSLLSSYRLLPYYAYSADRWFAEVHGEHHFQGIILSQIPLLKKIKAQEVAGIHFLSNNNLDYYYELNFGLERIFKILRIEYVLGYFPDNKLRQGFSVSMRIGF